MKITPLDIQQMVFKVRMRGYDRRDVNRFLEEVAQTVEVLNRDNSALRERLTATETQLAELKKTETTLTHTLVSTQALADEVKRIAERDAQLIVKEAEVKAAELIRKAGIELAALQRDLSDLRKQRILTIERFRSTIRTFERILEIEEGEVGEETDGEHAIRTDRVDRLTDSNRS
jgi:cell division initiation protein